MLLVLVGISLSGQSLINLKSVNVVPSGDTIFLDSLSIAQNTISFYDKENNNLEGIKYIFDFKKSAIIFKEIPDYEEITIEYKTFPINFFESHILFNKSEFLVGTAGSPLLL